MVRAFCADDSEELHDLEHDPHEWTNLAANPNFESTIADHKKLLPRIDPPPAAGSANRVLTYDRTTDEAI